MNSPKISELKYYAGRLETTRGHRAYNPAICWHAGDLICAYRVQDDIGMSSIAIGRLDRNLVTDFRDEELVMDHAAFGLPGGTHVEDPRLMSANGRLLLFVATVKYEGRWAFVQRCYVLNDDFEVEKEIHLPYHRNGQPGITQKNWVPFKTEDEDVGFVYQFSPFTTIRKDVVRVIGGSENVARSWRWGSVSGRTPALAMADGNFLCIIGGHMEHPKRKRLYWIGAAMFNLTEGLIGISSQPLLWASEREQAMVNPWDCHWNPLCLFPGGLAADPLEPGEALVSLGLNDSSCHFLRMPLDVLTASLVHPDEIEPDDKAVVIEKELSAPQGSQILVEVVQRAPLGEPGGPYMKGDKFLMTRERMESLGSGIVVEVKTEKQEVSHE